MKTTNDSHLMELIAELRNIKDSDHLEEVVAKLNKLDGVSEDIQRKIGDLNKIMHLIYNK